MTSSMSALTSGRPLSDEVFDFGTAIDRRNHSTPVDRRILIHGKPR